MFRRTEIFNKVMSNVKIVHRGFEIDGVPSPCHEWQSGYSG